MVRLRLSSRASGLTWALVLGLAACGGDVISPPGTEDASAEPGAAAPRDAGQLHTAGPRTPNPGRPDALGPGDARTDAAAADAAAVDAGAEEAADGGVPLADAGVEVDAGAPDPRRVAFVAQGHGGRTLLSCDDGRSWVADRSDVPTSRRCFSGGFDCDHQSHSGRGVASGDGGFVATFGWGAPGGLRRSADGVAWSSVLSGTTFGGAAYGGGVWVAGAPQARRSTDGGRTWSGPIDVGMRGYNVRRMGFVPHGPEGRFVIVGDAGDVVTSADGGRTWRRPRVLPAACGRNIQTRGGIAYGGGALVILGSGDVCRSTDGGETFTHAALGGEVSSHLLWTGAAFVAFGPGVRWSSPDGLTWASAPVQPASLRLGPVAYAPETGTFVGVRDGWGNVWYEDQELLRSEDGLRWGALPRDRFTGGHPITAIAAGRVEPSALCPLP